MNIIITNDKSQVTGIHKTHISLEEWILQEGENKSIISDEDFEMLLKSKDRHLFIRNKISIDKTPIEVISEVSELDQLKQQIEDMQETINILSLERGVKH